MGMCISILCAALSSDDIPVDWGTSLANCLINAQPLPAHRPAADDNSFIGCTRPQLDR